MNSSHLSKPFFSVVIPVYNREGFILKTIQSCLDQSLSDFEVIVVDDGSTDQTRQVISHIEDSRVSCVFQENKERGAARNRGLQMARGQYIFFLDSDDYLDAHHLENAHNTLRMLGAPELLFTGISFVDSSNELIGKTKDYGSVIERSVILKNNVCASAFFIRKDIALENPFSENRLLSGTEDRLLLTKLTADYTLHFRSFNTYYLVEHSGRSMASQSETFWTNQLAAFQEEMDDTLQLSSSEKNEVISSFKQMVAVKLWSVGKYSTGYRWYFKSLNSVSALFNRNLLRMLKYGIIKPVLRLK